MSKFDEFAASYPAITTRAELEQRMRDRAAPVAEFNLTPDGHDETSVNAHAARSNERRIAWLTRRLDREHQKIGTDHALSRMRGTARRDFGRADD